MQTALKGVGHVATRAIFVFDHPAFRYVAFICIGMVEVSTCFIEPNFRVAPDTRPATIRSNTELGRFEFGGSTHVMIFQPGKAKFSRARPSWRIGP